MANVLLPESLRGLILSAVDLRNMTQWPDALIEDYLNIVGNLITISAAINQRAYFLRTVTVVDSSMSPYDIKTTDQDVFFQTDGGDITASLPIGVVGQNYRLISVGNSGNKVTVNPNGIDTIFGAATEYIADKEALIVTFDTVEGWN